MDMSFFGRLNQDFLMIIDFLIVLKPFQAGEILNVLLVLVRIAEGKLDRFILIEHILDRAFYLAILIQVQFAF